MELDPEEAQRLVRVSRTARDRVRLRRAGMVLASLQGRSAPEIAVMFAAKEQTVRDVISVFTDRGFVVLDPKGHRGSMPKIGPAVREEICRTAKSDPAGLGCPFTCWNLTKLRNYLAEQKHTAVPGGDPADTQDVRISWQNTKTWKHSRDPEFTVKKDRILQLYDHPPPDGRVLCVDESGR